MKALVDLFLFLVILGAFWCLVINTARWFFGLVASRSDRKPEPHGAHPMAYGHPEQVPAELTDEELAAWTDLEARLESA